MGSLLYFCDLCGPPKPSLQTPVKNLCTRAKKGQGSIYQHIYESFHASRFLKRKKTVKSSVPFFVFSMGSEREKGARKMSLKLTLVPVFLIIFRSVAQFHSKISDMSFSMEYISGKGKSKHCN